MSKRFIVTSLLLAVIVALSFGAGCAIGGKSGSASEPGLDSIVEAWNIIFEDYVDEGKLDAAVLSEAAIRGMVEVLDDPYTSYLDAETYELGLGSLHGKIEGIGAQVTVRDGQLTIIAPIAGSPADKAGVRPGDTILEVNGSSAPEMSLAEAILKIRGPKGTSVRLLILHLGEGEPEEIEIIRAEIKLTSVRFEMRGDVAYISITRFSERTGEELAPAVESITQEAATGIILDLRSNPGGLLEAVVDVAGYFLTDGVVVKVVDRDGKEAPLTVKASQVVTDLPMVVLVDSFSASGSEVLAGALQDHGRAIIAGTRTFGKGSVNVLRQLKDGSGLYITSARWLTPDGRPIEGEGLLPDFNLEEEDAIQWAIDYLKGSSN
jgi:carboxyl-terminal processing protease